MRGIEHATLGVWICLIFLVVPVIWYIRKAQRGTQLFVRRIPGIDAIDEAVGRSAELGRPISFCTGLTDIGPTLLACLGTLYYVARKAARYKSRLLLPQIYPEVMAITEDIVRDAYRAEGKTGSFDPSSIVFLSSEQFAFAAGYVGMVMREKVATALLFGHFAAESLILAEAGQRTGAMQVGASVSPEQVAFFVCTCDYTLIGEELYASAAYLTQEPIQLGSLYGQDRAKLAIFLLIIAGALIATLNSVFAYRNSGITIPNFDALLFASLKDIQAWVTGVL